MYSSTAGQLHNYTHRVKIPGFRLKFENLKKFDHYFKCAELKDGQYHCGELGLLWEYTEDEDYPDIEYELFQILVKFLDDKCRHVEIKLIGPDEELLMSETNLPKRGQPLKLTGNKNLLLTIPARVFEKLEGKDDVVIEVTIFDHISDELVKEDTNKGSNKYNCGFGKMFDGAKYTDVVFRVGKEEIKAHKSVLVFKSKFFENMFDSELVEAKSGCIEIDDFEPNIIRAMLKYIYSGALEFESDDEELMEQSRFYSSLLMAADKFQLDDLRDDCEQAICDLISVENMEDLMIIASKYRLQKLQKKVAEFMSKNIKN